MLFHFYKIFSGPINASFNIILPWLLSYRLASILYIVFKKRFEREKVTKFFHTIMLFVLFVFLLFLPCFYFINSQSLHVNKWLGSMSYLLFSSYEPNTVALNVVLFSFPSSLQKAVEKLKVVMHHQPPATQPKIVIFWWPTMPQIQLILNSSWAGKETG